MAEQIAELNKGISDDGAFSTTTWKPTGRIWVDGKQIYERVFETTHSGTDSETNTHVTNIDTLIAHFSSYDSGSSKLTGHPGFGGNAPYTLYNNVKAYVYTYGGVNDLYIQYRANSALPSNTQIRTIVYATLQ